MVCQPKVSIAETMEALKRLDRGDNWMTVKEEMCASIAAQGRTTADVCEHCGLCEDICMMNLPIRDLLDKAVRDLDLP